MISPSAAYSRLLGRFGPQGWWPVTPAGASRPRYHPGRFARPGRRAAEEICIGAILTQNTAWTNVEKALERLHARRGASFSALARMPAAALRRAIRPSGFFNQKAVRLKDFASHALSRPILPAWLRGPLPALRDELLALRGVGPETADSILLYAGHREAFVVDAYTRRIGERLGWFPAGLSYGEVQAFFTRRLRRSVTLYQEFHALLVVLAKEHCRKDPVCGGCPLAKRCPAAKG